MRAAIIKKQLLFKIALACGYLPMSVGGLIFLIWWGAREFYALDLYKLERMGYDWALIALGILLIGLLLLVVFLVKKGKRGLGKSAVILVLLLLNYPVCRVLLGKRAELEQYAYVKVKNNTEQDHIALSIHPYFPGGNAVRLARGKGKVFRYTPEYTYTGDREYTVNTATLLVQTPNEKYRITLPPVKRDDCRRFYVDKDFILQNE
ncbi:hypothetical protein [Sinomicrobium weinanense]|uniref:Uncharacterized protein n=1 Tax=Sinomicrobium weinanense TaxID=2842200 RepID=A0A926Q5R4_9FLAO|nr:hypothetical protein [Sinomicrobium weinanense]MBC9798265.1 hypothetical protein [Sinomicrobium weinanense]